MRRIFPLKSTSNHGPSGSLPQKDCARLKSRDPPDATKVSLSSSSGRIKKGDEGSFSGSSGRNRKVDASTSEDAKAAALRIKREHWCPSCPAAENGVRCETPPSGDENIVAKEEEKGVISPMREIVRGPHRGTHENDAKDKQAALDLDEALRSVVAGAMRSADCCSTAVDDYKSRRSGLGAVDNLIHERGTKPHVKTKTATQGPVRAISAPKVRPEDRPGSAELPRVHSMRILRVPDRVFDSHGESPRLFGGSPGGSSSLQNATPRARAAYEKARLSVLSNMHTRSNSHTEGLNIKGSDRPPISTPSSYSSRKALDSPRSLRKDPGGPTAIEITDKGQSKYSGARIVAERFAKAFRSTSKSTGKEEKNLVDGDRLTNKSGIGQSKRMLVEQADPSYDGSCSDTSTQREENVSLLNVLPLVKPGEIHPNTSRKEGSVLTWQEFITDGRASQGRTSDNYGNPLPERSPRAVGLATVEPGSAGRRPPTPPSSAERLARQHSFASTQQEAKEREVLKSWLEGLKRQSEGMNDDLEVKARLAEERVAVLNGDQSSLDDQLDMLRELQGDDYGRSNVSAGMNLIQQRIRKTHDEKKRLALEVASEVKRRITERAAAKEVLIMMKREMEACVRVMEKEKVELQTGFERELQRRENDWCNTLDEIRVEEKMLREKVRRLEEEKGGLQSELAGVGSKESGLREKVRDFELQMDGHRMRVEEAERTILDLRQSLAISGQQARQAESEVEAVKMAYLETERENQSLGEQVQRLQQLCVDHETSIEGLQQGLKNGFRKGAEQRDGVAVVKKELVRLSEIERSLRTELESLRTEAITLRHENRTLSKKLESLVDVKGKSDQHLQAEIADLQLHTVELQNENNLLSANLNLAVSERDSEREVLRSLESNLSGIQTEKRALEEEVGQEKTKIHEKEREIQRLERRVDGLLKNNQMLQNILAMREKAAQAYDEEAKVKEKVFREAQQMESDMRESLQVSARQLCYMNERAELLSDKLSEREGQLTAVKSECAKKDEVVRGLEQSLGDLAKSLDAQNRRILQLTTRNEELFRLYHSKSKEVEDLHTKIVEDAELRRTCNNEMNQLAGEANDVKQDLESQNMLCKLLKEKLVQREDDMKKQREEINSLVQSRDWLQAELNRVQHALVDATHRLSGLERSLGQNEELLSSLQAEKEVHFKELTKLREALPRAERDRDVMQEEAEEIGREALRMSAEVEVLRRKVAQLEEDVMVKEGQISILRGSCFEPSE